MRCYRGRKFLCLIFFFIAFPAFSQGFIVDPAWKGQLNIIGELGLAELPETLVFTRSDSATVIYDWSVRIRIWMDTTDVPDNYALSIRYSELPGDESFKGSAIQVCSWLFERKSVEMTFYRFGDIEVIPTDSSLIMTARISPSFFRNVDSIQVFALTDYIPNGKYKLRDMTDIGHLGEIIRDPIGDMEDKRFDISFVRVDIEGLIKK